MLINQDLLRQELLHGLHAAMVPGQDKALANYAVLLLEDGETVAEFGMREAIDTINNGLWWNEQGDWRNADALAVIDDCGREVYRS